ncbi:penicillin-binding transpeptidase domain-containing protein [Actinotalea subterranea]|uniref:penicillin-binding transpeptidase domain-containing protein n=1 Tax=Actinotalea subterranea TaxID=2607497 RepID=UPI001FE76011|nr:penicillin-binding transpeptidase domain-containing protein [Actinotalea subterranea]
MRAAGDRRRVRHGGSVGGHGGVGGHDAARALPRVARRALVGVLGVALSGGLAACTAGPPKPDDVARALADGIAAADLGDVALSGATPAEATEQAVAAYAGLDPDLPAVEVGDITVDDEGTTATVPLDFTWDLDANEADWTYTTTAHLDLVDDAWVARWSSFLLAPDLRETETLSRRRDAPAERATVLGAEGGEVLVEPRAVLRLGVDKTRVEAPGQAEAAAQVAAVVGIDPAEYAARVAAAGEKAFVEAIVVREENPGLDLGAFSDIAGALSVKDTLPLAPTRRFARPVLGTAGPATAEIVEEAGGAVVAGDTVGLSGLQRQYDEQLRGLPGFTVLATAADTGQVRELYRVDPVAGEPLVTTLVAAYQDAAETVLEDVAPPSAIVVIRPSTGAVLAAASGPGGEGYSTATLGTYAPGSVFKVVSSLAALRAGLTPASTVDCPASTVVDGRTFENFPGYPAQALGSIPLRTAVAHSCNTAFIGLREQVPATALTDAAASLGLGVEADLGYPTFLGAVPSDATGTDHAASMIGQGRIQASPLVMAAVAASVASGHRVTPWLVGPQAPQAPEVATPLTAEETAALQEMLRAVVTEGGATFLQDVPAPDVLAKTGTAQYSADGELRNHTWMVAVHGDVAISVFVETGDYGSTTSGPLLEELLALTGL